MTVKYIGNAIYVGVSGDTKPTTGVAAGARFFETDTGAVYFYISSTWTIILPSTRTINPLNGFVQFTPIADPGSPGGTSRRLYVDSTANTLFIKKPDGSTIDIEAIAAGAGENNTMSNVGAGGIGFFKVKTGVNFEMKTIAEGTSGTIAITDDTIDNEIELDVDQTNISIQNLSDTLLATQLPIEAFRKDQDNTLGDHFIEFGDIAAPANPAAGVIRLFNDTATGELSVRKSGGTTVSLETGGAGGGTGDINDAANTGIGGVGLFIAAVGDILEFKNINAGSNKITITDDPTNDEVDIDVAQANLTLSSIGGSVTGGQLPATAVQTGQTNTFGDFAQLFRSGKLELRDSDNSHSYLLTGSNLAANRTVTFPLLAGNDTVAMEAFAQAFTNKTINSTDNSITATSQAAGDILKNNGSKFVRLPRGTALQVIRTNSGGTDIEWASLDSERVGKSTANGDGVTTTFNIAHGLGGTPTYAFVDCSSHAIARTWTVDGTNIAVTFASAPGSGTNNVIIYWRVVA